MSSGASTSTTVTAAAPAATQADVGNCYAERANGLFKVWLPTRAVTPTRRRRTLGPHWLAARRIGSVSNANARPRWSSSANRTSSGRAAAGAAGSERSTGPPTSASPDLRRDCSGPAPSAQRLRYVRVANTDLEQRCDNRELLSVRVPDVRNCVPAQVRNAKLSARRNQ